MAALESDPFHGALETGVTSKLCLASIRWIAIQILQHQTQQLGEGKRGILLSDDDETTLLESLCKDRAGQRFAAANFPGQHSEKHGLFAHEKSQTAQRLVMLPVLEEKARVPRWFERTLTQSPI